VAAIGMYRFRSAVLALLARAQRNRAVLVLSETVLVLVIESRL